MPKKTSSSSNQLNKRSPKSIRESVLATITAMLEEIIPDDVVDDAIDYATDAASGDAPSVSFNDLEAFATKTGDGVVAALIKTAIEKVIRQLPRPERCPDCGGSLDASVRTVTVKTIRGPVEVPRLYAYCRACKRGFFPQ